MERITKDHLTSMFLAGDNLCGINLRGSDLRGIDLSSGMGRVAARLSVQTWRDQILGVLA